MQADVSLGIQLGQNTKLFARHIKLLKAVAATGSITKAAALRQISYKTAWDTLDMLNNKSPEPLLLRSDGSKKNSGTRLSSYAIELIKSFEALLAVQQNFLDCVLKSDLNSEQLSRLGVLFLGLSARNQLSCEIDGIKKSKLNSEIFLKLKSGEILTTQISNASLEALGLKKGQSVNAIFKAPKVSLSQSKVPNSILGKISAIALDESSAEINLSTSSAFSITASTSLAMAQGLEIGQELFAHIKAEDIIIGV